MVSRSGYSPAAISREAFWRTSEPTRNSISSSTLVFSCRYWPTGVSIHGSTVEVAAAICSSEKVAGVLSSPVAAALPSPAEAGSFASVGVPDEHPASMATAIASAMSSAMLFFAVISIPPCVICASGEMLMFCDDFTSSQFTQGFTKNQYAFRCFSTGFRMLKHKG